MALAEQRRTPPPPSAHLDVRVAPSAAVELHWVTMTEPDGRLRVEHPSLAALAADDDLVARIAAMWPGTSPDASPTARSFPELLVLADRAGVLAATDLDEVLDGVGHAAARPAADPLLASEDPADRQLILSRLRTLRADRARRAAWLHVLAAAADAVRAHWERTGLESTRRAARARASQLPWTEPAAAVLAWAGRDYGGLLPELLAVAARDGRPVLVTPAYWSGGGVLFDLEHHLLVGIPAQLGASDSRARTEPWTRELKALADPTRLAILDHLGAGPRTISEVAADFGVAQPTASRHVRLLREAGLLVEERHGPRATVRADPVAVRRVLEGLAATLAGGPGGPSGLEVDA